MDRLSACATLWGMRGMLTVCLLVAAAAVTGGCGSEEPSSAAPAADAAEALRGAPPELAALHKDANRFLEGGPEAFEKRLAELRGRPVVVNKWASWCGPCRAEFPFFQKQSVARGKEIAFIGVNALDNDQDAAEFAEQFPVSYPHYRDPDQEIAKVFKGNAGFPTTAYYDSRGRLVIAKQGGYATEAKLVEDIERYAK